MKSQYGTGEIGTLWRHISFPVDVADDSAVSGYGCCDVGRVQDSNLPYPNSVPMIKLTRIV